MIVVSNVLSWLRDSYAAYPQKVAVSDIETEISYEMLWKKACIAGFELHRRMGGKKNRPVFVCIGRNTESILAFFSVLASGNFYVPVDCALPDKRLTDIYDTMQPELIITTEALKKPLPFPVEKSVSLEELANADGGFDAGEPFVCRTIERSLDTDPVYCIFTSGSTGVPKGVLISHRSIIDMAEQFAETFSLDESQVFGNQAPFDFDVSVKDIYLTVRCGASVHILDKPLFMMPKKLMERLDQFGVNTLIWAASAMKIVSALKTFESVVPEGLRLVMFSGEALPCKVLNDWRGHLPGVRFVNLYGPTEITCNCTYYIIDREFADSDSLPAGRPFVNSGVFLLDRGECIGKETGEGVEETDGKAVTEPGTVGEICVKGTCLALGYYGMPEKTREAFCQNPLQTEWPERIYRTGDLGRWDEEGNLHFVGRADTQIKHMGHRIELGELETAANAIGFIGSAACLYHEQREKICLFYQADVQDDKAVFRR